MQLQYLEGGHGKKLVDGNVFGNQNVGGTLNRLRNTTRLYSYQQLRDECENFKKSTKLLWTDEQKDLRKHMFILWEPTAQQIPKKVSKLIVHRMTSFRCWRSSVRWLHRCYRRKNSQPWYQICAKRGAGVTAGISLESGKR